MNPERKIRQRNAMFNKGCSSLDWLRGTKTYRHRPISSLIEQNILQDAKRRRQRDAKNKRRKNDRKRQEKT
jgi:hypothetical protein